MIDRLLALVRGIVRSTIAVAVALVWGYSFGFILVYKPLPVEIKVGIISVFLGIAGTAIAFWFAQRKPGS